MMKRQEKGLQVFTVIRYRIRLGLLEVTAE
jgi:hypothetical protein